MPLSVHNRIEVLYSAEEISKTVHRMSEDIVQTIHEDVMIVSLLRGSFVFAADLIRAIHDASNNTLKPQVDFLTLSSYGDGIVSSGSIKLIRDLTESVTNRDVLIIDDILESGHTLTYARDLILRKQARSVKIAVLLEKPGKRKVDLHANFVGFTIPDHFVVGYGLDYANYYRELPYIGILPDSGETTSQE